MLTARPITHLPLTEEQKKPYYKKIFGKMEEARSIVRLQEKDYHDPEYRKLSETHL